MILRHASPGMACRDSWREGGRDIVDLLWLEPKSARLPYATRGLLVCNVVEGEGAISVTQVTTHPWANEIARSAQAARNSRHGVGEFGPRRSEAFPLACKGRGSAAALANRGAPRPNTDFRPRHIHILIPKCTNKNV